MALILTIKVVPGSGSQYWKLDKSGQLKCFLKSQPEKGKANKELITFLAQTLQVPTTAVEILTGEAARLKRVRISIDLSFERVLERLGLQLPDKPLNFL